MMKKCRRCNNIKPTTEFDLTSDKKCLRSKCRPCFKAWRTEYNRQYKRKNPKYQAAYHIRHRDGRFGMPAGWFERKLAEQNSGCAICGRTQSDVREYRLHIDHDHKCCPAKPRKNVKTCGKCTRGILCLSCNTFVARIEKLGKDGLARALAYLAQYP